MDKLKFAIYWAAACGGCDVAILDINEKILDVAANVDIVLWPIALDFKYKDVEALPDGSVSQPFCGDSFSELACPAIKSSN